MFLHHSFMPFSVCINRIYIVYSTEFSWFFISSFNSLYSRNTVCTETYSSWLIYDLIKILDIRTSIVSNLVIPSNTILSCSFFFFLIIDLYYLIPSVIVQTFNPTAELVTPIGMSTNEANAEKNTTRNSRNEKKRMVKVI